jgi:hypothetical protein
VHVNTLAAMVARHYPYPHRFYCVTDDPHGIDPSITTIPLWDDFSTLRNPSNPNGPSCYRRLRIFSPEARQIFGERLVTLDLDTIIVGDVTPLWSRPEDIVLWGDTNRTTHYNGSMILLRTGTRTKVWTDFDPRTSPARTKAQRQFGSDQGWISYCLGRREAMWTLNDGVYSWRGHLLPRGGALPDNARIVMFHGKQKPWSDEARNKHGWIREHYRQ